MIRLAPTVHSDIDHHGFIPALIGFARESGVAGYVGEGANRWPAVHTLDAARLYRLAVESAPAGTRLHGVGEEAIEFTKIAEAIAAGAGLDTRSVSQEETPTYLGYLSTFAGLDNPTSSEATQELLGWKPEHRGLLEDLAEGHYFS